MQNLPHNFPTLRRDGSGNHRRSLLVIGAGMSHGMVPLPRVLLAEKRAEAEKKLGCTTSLAQGASSSNGDLYRWADEIVAVLKGRGDRNPKLTLAQLLGIPSDPRWRGCASALRCPPAHRVIARFAREGLWEQIWSLNWDCVLESALENVGIKRERDDADVPWPTVFHTFITAAQCANLAEAYSVKLVKPHGCVFALVLAEEDMRRGKLGMSCDLAGRFLITASELTSLAPAHDGNGTQQFIFATLCSKLCSHPLVIAGWSVSEEYLLGFIEQTVKPALEQRPLPEDELSIIDVAFNDAGHARLGACYGREATTAHFRVEQSGFSAHDLFLWVQSLYAVGCLHRAAGDSDRPALEQIAAQIQQPPTAPSFIIGWADSFLPVWVRLCWRCGLVRCRNRRHEPISVNDVDLESRDEHVPWHVPNIERPDLQAAAALLAALHRSGRSARWDFDRFPGALSYNRELIVPLPAWDTDKLSDLRGLKPLLTALKECGLGFVERLAVLPVGTDPSVPVADDVKRSLRELFVRELDAARFSQPEKVRELELKDL